MALMDYEMKCVDCGSSEHTSIKMVLTKNHLVQFHIICFSDTCNGNYSHQLEYTDINRAVRQYLIESAEKALASMKVLEKITLERERD